MTYPTPQYPGPGTPEPRPPHKRAAWIVPVGVGVACLVVGAAAGSAGNKDKTKAGPVTSVVAVAEPGPTVVHTVAPTVTVAPTATITVRPTVIKTTATR